MANTNTTQHQADDASKLPAQLDGQSDAAEQDDQVARRKANARTEAEAQSVDGMAGQSGKSSHDAMSHNKADSHEGAGGGKKQERHH
ncbi:hypothetical protein [Noviherbaspirillum sp.]|uniref:hypothetical protein n=1 Tax=Noviherbaspirillum sp. TaxID=1926288 RepID=UPI002FE06485